MMNNAHMLRLIDKVVIELDLKQSAQCLKTLLDLEREAIRCEYDEIAFIAGCAPDEYNGLLRSNPDQAEARLRSAIGKLKNISLRIRGAK